ncbi:MAG: tetratricopeptide repeat protein [Acidobacteriota bacterium]
MPVLSAENNYKKGLVAMVEGRPAVARELFLAAMEEEKCHGVTPVQRRYLSHYGLSLALSGGETGQAVEACRKAIRGESRDPVLFLNLGKVELMAGRRGQAIRAFKRGLSIDPGHGGLTEALKRADRRRGRPHPTPGRARWSGGSRGGLPSVYGSVQREEDCRPGKGRPGLNLR